MISTKIVENMSQQLMQENLLNVTNSSKINMFAV